MCWGIRLNKNYSGDYDNDDDDDDDDDGLLINAVALQNCKPSGA
jgi:hypothetical protein